MLALGIPGVVDTVRVPVRWGAVQCCSSVVCEYGGLLYGMAQECQECLSAHPRVGTSIEERTLDSGLVDQRDYMNWGSPGRHLPSGFCGEPKVLDELVK